MAAKVIAECASCGYPLAAEYSGQIATCPMCGTVNEAISQGVTIPTWLFSFTLGLAAGIILGPAIIGSTDAGARWLEKRARAKLAG
jgi:phage FluMu protein Com